MIYPGKTAKGPFFVEQGCRLTRRAFLSVSGAGAGLSAVSRQGAHGQAASGESGKRIIDCQSHLFVPQIVTLMRKRREDPTVYERDGDSYIKMGDWHRKILPNHMDLQAKVESMDSNGISITALSINDPGPEWFGEQAPEVARIANEFIADCVHRYPGRFLGLCVLPMLNEKAALEELDHCVTQLGMKGILLYTNLKGRYPDEPEFEFIFAKAVENNLPVLLHPAKPVTTEQVKGYEMTSSLGNMFDDTIALTRIIMSGILDRHPDLKLVCPHLGGTLPFIIGRLNHQTEVLKRGPKYLTMSPQEYLGRVYLDIVSPLPAAMKFSWEMLGANRLIYSSDHPWVSPKLILDSLRSLKLPPEDEAKILGGNAARLFGL